MLFIAVLPLVVSSLALGVLELGDVRRLGRVGALTLAYTLVVSAGSVAIGVGLVNFLRPGDGFDPVERARLIETLAPQAQKVVTQAAQASSPVDALISIVPRNPFEALVRAFDGEMLGVMFFALLLGVALVTTPRERTSGLVSALEGLYAVSLRIIDLAMTLAPYGVFALVFSLTARLGGDLLLTLGRYVGVVLLGLALQQFGVYSLLVRYAIGISPWLFFTRLSEVMTTAFSTSSSAATLPTALRVSEERVGVPREINSFVLTVGATRTRTARRCSRASPCCSWRSSSASSSASVSRRPSSCSRSSPASAPPAFPAVRCR
jgi:DAACS family dicarboxylate/amino acid:cation (Na+ or H+) symporter